VIQPPRSLAAKALVRRGAGETDALAIERADRALDTLREEFGSWMAAEVDRLEAACDGFSRAATPIRGESRAVFFRAAHDLRGNALQFGYPAASRIADTLCDLLEGESLDEVPEALLRRHVKAIRATLRFGQGRHAGADALAASLAEAAAMRIPPVPPEAAS
jgi:hypothetical protein